MWWKATEEAAGMLTSALHVWVHMIHTPHMCTRTRAHTRTGPPAGVGWAEKDTKVSTGMENAHTLWGG